MRVVAPAVILRILADPKFHENLDARAEAHRAGTHPNDREQNQLAEGIVTQREAVATATGDQKTIEGVRLGLLLTAYINAYFPHL